MSRRLFIMTLLASAGCAASPSDELETPDASAADAHSDAGASDSGVTDAASAACTAAGFEDTALDDHLIVIVQNAASDPVSGATVLVRRSGVQIWEGSTDTSGCAQLFDAELAEGGVVEVRASPTYAPVTRLADPQALQRFVLYPVAARPPAPSPTGRVEGTIPNLDIAAAHPDAIEARAHVFPILTSPWVRGMQDPELTDGGYFENSVYVSSRGADREYRIDARVGEHRGFSTFAGASFPYYERRYEWMGWRLFEVAEGEMISNFDIELTVPLIDRGRIELSRTGPWRTGFLEIPGVGIMYLAGEGVRGELIRIPRLEGALAGARLGAYARQRLDLDDGFYDRVAYAQTGTTTIVFDDDWLELEVFGVRGDTFNFSSARSREKWTICEISVLDLEDKVLAQLVDFSGERTLPMPTKTGTNERIDLPERVKIEVRCERYPGWVPGVGARDIYLEHRWYRTSEHNVR